MESARASTSSRRRWRPCFDAPSARRFPRRWMIEQRHAVGRPRRAPPLRPRRVRAPRSAGGRARTRARIVMLDSVAGYRPLACRARSSRSIIHALCAYLRNMGVTVLLVNEIETITGDFCDDRDRNQPPRQTTSSSCATSSSVAGSSAQSVSSKKRVSGFETTLREFEISPGGIRVAGPSPSSAASSPGSPGGHQRTPATAHRGNAAREAGQHEPHRRPHRARGRIDDFSSSGSRSHHEVAVPESRRARHRIRPRHRRRTFSRAATAAGSRP